MQKKVDFKVNSRTNHYYDVVDKKTAQFNVVSVILHHSDFISAV